MRQGRCSGDKDPPQVAGPQRGVAKLTKGEQMANAEADLNALISNTLILNKKRKLVFYQFLKIPWIYLYKQTTFISI